MVLIISQPHVYFNGNFCTAEGGRHFYHEQKPDPPSSLQTLKKSISRTPSTIRFTTMSSPGLNGRFSSSIIIQDRKTSHPKPSKQEVTITKASLTPLRAPHPSQQFRSKNSKPSVPLPKEPILPSRKISASSTNRKSEDSKMPAFSPKWP